MKPGGVHTKRLRKPPNDMNDQKVDCGVDVSKAHLDAFINLLSLKQTIQITILSIISYTLVTLLMSQDILIAYPSYGVSKALVETSSAMILRICIFVFFGIASAYVSRRCDYINQKEKQFREITQIIFQHVKAGLLLLDAKDKIIMANDRACILLGRDEPELTGKDLSSIHLKPSEIKEEDHDLRGASDYFRRADGSVFPVSIEDAQLSLPAEAVPNTHARPNTLVETRIINFNDLSNFMRLQSRIRQLKRIRSAANMAKEMAYQIRSPLTGISGAAQLLQFNCKKPPTQKGSAQEQENLYDQIVQEAARMENVIQKFLGYAEFSPRDIRDLIQMDIDREIGAKKTGLNPRVFSKIICMQVAFPMDGNSRK